MKRLVITHCWIFLLLTASMYAQNGTLFTYGKKAVSTADFLRAYKKNPDTGKQQDGLKEYLPLYINYRLKVQAALDLRMDTLPLHIQETEGYNTQLRDNYIADKAGLDNLTDEAIHRMQQDILLGYIFFGGPDINKAKIIASEAWQALKKGEPWEKVAARFNGDPEMAAREGVAGWMTTFVLPYIFENEIYALETGGYSEPMVASEGVYIFSKRAVRPGSGKVEVGQILFAYLTGITDPEKAMKRALADSIAGLLKNGASLNELATAYSQDRTTNQKGGIIAPFTIGTYDADFESTAFGLKKPGDVSHPVVTSMGVHVLQLISKMPPPEVENMEERERVKQQVVSTGRLIIAQNNYLISLIPAIPFKGGMVTEKWLQIYTDSLLQIKDPKTPRATLLFTYGKGGITLDDWVAYARVQANAGTLQPGSDINLTYATFSKGKKLDYLKVNLEEADPIFAKQIQDFKEANLLFEAMSQQVWAKASNDTKGLQTFFDKNKDNYRWGPNAIAILVNTTDSLLAQKAVMDLTNNRDDWRQLSTKYENEVFADSGRYEATMMPLAESAWPETGKCSAPQRNSLDGSYSFMCMLEKGAKGGIRSFEQAKGYVISDYQEALENKWLDSIRKKYPVKVNQAVWKQVLSAR